MHAQGKPLEIRVQDEARVGQKGTPTYIWGEKGKRPRALRDQRYECAYIVTLWRDPPCLAGE